MRTLLILFITVFILCLLLLAGVAGAVPTATDCDEASENGRQSFDHTEKEFYVCRDHTVGW